MTLGLAGGANKHQASSIKQQATEKVFFAPPRLCGSNFQTLNIQPSNLKLQTFIQVTSLSISFRFIYHHIAANVLTILTFAFS